MFENLFQNLLAVGVLLALAVLGYCRITGKTLLDLIRELGELLKGKQNE